MKNRNNQWVSPDEGKWKAHSEGSSNGSIFSTQSAAWNHAQQMARLMGSEAFLQGRNGQIRERNTYGPDPRKSKG